MLNFFFERKRVRKYDILRETQNPAPRAWDRGREKNREENIEMERLYRAGVATPVSGKNFVIETKEKHSATK